MLAEPLVVVVDGDKESIELNQMTAPAAPSSDFVEISIETPRNVVKEKEEEEERLYLRPAARKAYYVASVETLQEFKRVTGKSFENQWECVNSPSSPFVVLTMPAAPTYMLKAQLPRNLPASRILRMCIDFDPATRLRWDSDLTYVRVLEEFPDDSMRVVQWKARKPSLAILSHPPGGISVLLWDEKAQYVVARHIPEHRRVADGDTSQYSKVEGWSALYITPATNTLVAVFHLQCRDMPGYAAYYAKMLEERVTLMEEICSSKWNYYYT
jgi:hypothetical protein